MTRHLKSLGSGLLSIGIILAAFAVVAAGYKSNAEARNNSNRWDEECFSEGCDNEEREEMFDHGDFNEETREWSVNDNKPGFSAVFEAAELAAPNLTSHVAWGRCAGMMSDFVNHINKNTTDVNTVWNDCWNRFSAGQATPLIGDDFHRNH